MADFFERNKQFFGKLMTMFEQQYGSNNEIVLHDFTKPYDQTIIDIRNGHITGRKIGDCVSNLGLEVLQGTVEDGDRYNYITHLKSSRILRSSSMYFHGDDGTVLGCLCINTDITETVRFEEYLKRYNNYEFSDMPPPSMSAEEYFPDNVHDLLDYLIEQGQKKLGLPNGEMSRDEKLRFLRYLDGKGAFIISKSGEKVCEHMNISKYTLYKYLEIVRTGRDAGEDSEDKPLE